MRRHTSIMACLAIIFCLTLSITAAAQEAKPGDSVTVAIPFSSTEPLLALQVDYSISDGLQFVSGVSSGGMMGSANSNRAIFISLGGSLGGTVTLHLKVRDDAIGEQSVMVTSVTGGSSGETSQKVVGSAGTHTFNIISSPESTAWMTSAPEVTAAPTVISTGASTAIPKGTPTPTASPTAMPMSTTQPTAASINRPSSPQTPVPTDQPVFVISAPDGFEVLNAPDASVPKYFTGIQIPGLSHPLYAFTDKEERTQFRVSGKLDKREGMYDVQVLTEMSEETLVLRPVVVSMKPVKDKLSNRSEAKPVAVDHNSLPDGFETTSKDGVVHFINLFGQKEYRVYGELSSGEKAYFPVIKNRPRYGALAIDIEADKERMASNGDKFYPIPKEYRKGFAIRVFITTSDGISVSVWTEAPVLDVGMIMRGEK